MAAAGFSDLPTEALDEIARRVGPFDNVSCAAVCKPWRRALYTARTRRLKKPPTNRPLYVCVEPRHELCPWELAYGRKRESWANKVCVFARPTNGYGCPQDMIGVAIDGGGAPAQYPTRVIGGSRYGWVVTVDKSCSLSLLEPLTGRRFPLPPITSSLGRSKKLHKDLNLMGQDMFRKAALAPGRRLGTFAVMLIHGGTGYAGLSFLAPGSKSWTALRAPAWAPKNYLDVLLHKGVFYTVSIDAELNAWAPDGSSTGLRARLAVASPRADQRLWAVLVHADSRSRDDLLMVSTPVGGCGLYAGKLFDVSRYDERQRRWIPEMNRGDLTILLNDNGGVCVSRQRMPESPPMATGTWWPADIKYSSDPSYDRLFLGYGGWFLPYVAPVSPHN